MLVAFLAASSVTFLAASLALGLRGEPELSGLAGAMGSVCVLVAGLVSHVNLVTALGAAGLAAAFIRWGGPRRRRRVRKVMGDKSRAIRARLAARMPRGARPGPSPSPR